MYILEDLKIIIIIIIINRLLLSFRTGTTIYIFSTFISNDSSIFTFTLQKLKLFSSLFMNFIIQSCKLAFQSILIAH